MSAKSSSFTKRSSQLHQKTTLQSIASKDDASKHHAHILVANNFHYPRLSPVLQRLAGASRKTHNSPLGKELALVNSFGFQISHLLDRIISPASCTDKHKKHGGLSLTHRNVSMARVVHWCYTLLPLHMSKILAPLVPHSYMDHIIST